MHIQMLGSTHKFPERGLMNVSICTHFICSGFEGGIAISIAGRISCNHCEIFLCLQSNTQLPNIIILVLGSTTG